MEKLVYDSFKVRIKQQLNSEDNHALTLLYLPLMGIDSFATYHALMALDDNETYTFKRLLDLLNIVNINLLNKAIDKLEGLGLIKSYYSDRKGFLYEMFTPLSFSDFFDNEVLVEYLEAHVGEIEVKKLKDKYNYRIVGYRDVTKHFNDVFQSSTKSIEKTLHKLVKPGIKIENQDFNYPLFKLLLSDSGISEDVLDEDDFKNRIIRISYIYKLSEEEMKDVLIKTLEVDKDFEYASIAKNARKVFQKKYQVDKPKLETIHEDHFVPSTSDDETQMILNLVENMQITDVLENISGIKPSNSEIKVFEELMKNTNLSSGVINMMILYVNAEKNGELPGYNYFEKIANTWARAKIKTPYDALKYLERRKENQNEKPVKVKQKTVKPLPDWYHEYTKQLQSSQKEEQKSSPKTQELIDFVKDMLG
ncbi:MAG TPA: DnaD domain protein [Bacilli bacterium]